MIFYILTVVLSKNTVLWDVMLCSVLGGCATSLFRAEDSLLPSCLCEKSVVSVIVQKICTSSLISDLYNAPCSSDCNTMQSSMLLPEYMV